MGLLVTKIQSSYINDHSLQEFVSALGRKIHSLVKFVRRSSLNLKVNEFLSTCIGRGPGFQMVTAASNIKNKGARREVVGNIVGFAHLSQLGKLMEMVQAFEFVESTF